MTDLALDEDDDGEAAVMEDSDLEDEEDEVCHYISTACKYLKCT